MTAAVTGHTTTDRVEDTDHARERWEERADVTYPVADAWRDAEPLSWPGVHNALYARYHSESGLVLIAQRDVLIGVYPLSFIDKAADRLAEDLKHVGRIHGGGR